MPVQTNPIDLTDLATVKRYLSIPVTATADDQEIQDLITGVSQYWLTRTGRGSLNSVVTYTEYYDGTGRDLLMLRRWPVVSVRSLVVDGIPIAASPDYRQPGYVLNNQRDTIYLVNSRTLFWCGRLNVMVMYDAGYAGVPFDIENAVIKQVGVNYKRKSTIDQSSMTVGQTGGTTSWRSWAIPPECEQILQAYRQTIPY